MNNKGWECPKCGNCYSPLTTRCFNCSQVQQKIKVESLNFDCRNNKPEQYVGLRVDEENKNIFIRLMPLYCEQCMQMSQKCNECMDRDKKFCREYGVTFDENFANKW